MIFCVSFLMITRWLPQLQTSSHQCPSQEEMDRWKGAFFLSERTLSQKFSPSWIPLTAHFPKPVTWPAVGKHGKQHLGKGSEMAVIGLTKDFQPRLHIKITGVVLEEYVRACVCAHVYKYTHISKCIHTCLPGPYHRPTESQPLVVILSGNRVESKCHSSRSRMVLVPRAGRYFT